LRVRRARSSTYTTLFRSLMPPGPDNPLGFWEHQGIVSVHEALLVALARRWDDPRPMPDGWLDSPAARDAARSLADLVRRDFAGQDRKSTRLNSSHVKSSY